MKGIYDGYTPYPHKGEACFAGANTGRGFIGSYHVIVPEGSFDDGLERVYIIKGGSGTGKSTLMKKAAAEAEKRNLPVKYCYCGSDPDSLDAVILDGRIAVLDGTAPHVLDMKYPGACSSLIDVSRFWSEEQLEEQKEAIIAYSQRKSALYQSAYQYLRAAEVLDNEITQTLFHAIDREKMRRWAERMAKSLCGREVRKAVSGKAEAKSVYTCGITMKGMVSLSTFAEKAEARWGVNDVYGSASLLFNELGSAFIRLGLSVEYGRIPVNDKICGLYVPDIRCAFTVNRGGEEENGKTLNMSRFIVKERFDPIKGRLKFTRKCINSMLDEAVSLLAEAGEQHHALEKIYIDRMDFKALNRYTNQVLGKIGEKLTTS